MRSHEYNTLWKMSKSNNVIIIFFIASIFPKVLVSLAIVPVHNRKSAKWGCMDASHDNNHDKSVSATSQGNLIKRSYVTLPRLFVGQQEKQLYPGARVPLTSDQAHYLMKVHRLRPIVVDNNNNNQDYSRQPLNVRVFDGIHGEWLGRLIQSDDDSGKRIQQRRQQQSSGVIAIECTEQQLRTQEQCVTTTAPSCCILFGPIRKERIKFLLEKCTELGVRTFIPVQTSRTDSIHADKLDPEKMNLQVIEASEQCERLSIPTVLFNPLKNASSNQQKEPAIANLKDLLDHWDKLQIFNNTTATSPSSNDAVLLVCRERESGEHTRPIMETLQYYKQRSIAFLLGPEGGWSPDEESLFDDNMEAYTFLHSVSLGRGLVLRTETAAIIAAGAFFTTSVV